MTLRIVELDMLKLSRLTKRRVIPVHRSQPAVDRRVSGTNITDVALEVLDINGIKADDCREKTDIGLGDCVAEEEGRDCGLLGQVCLNFVERVEEGCYGFLVCFLGSREAGLVDSIVDVVVDPIVCFIDLLAQSSRVEV